MTDIGWNKNSLMPLSALSLAEKHGYEHEEVAVEQILLDSTFWQALGRALAWQHAEICKTCGKQNGYDDKAYHCGGMHDFEWQLHAHQLFDLILRGKNVRTFWEQLLETTS